MQTAHYSILIIDDSPLIRGRIRHALELSDCIQIHGEAGSLSTSDQTLRYGTPSLIILDLSLGEESGMDILRAYRYKLSKTIFLVLTNDSAEPIRQKCIALGADYFFDKSIEFEQAMDTIFDLAKSHSPNGCPDK